LSRGRKDRWWKSPGFTSEMTPKHHVSALRA
jgi:hypothetical protein